MLKSNPYCLVLSLCLNKDMNNQHLCILDLLNENNLYQMLNYLPTNKEHLASCLLLALCYVKKGYHSGLHIRLNSNSLNSRGKPHYLLCKYRNRNYRMDPINHIVPDIPIPLQKFHELIP